MARTQCLLKLLTRGTGTAGARQLEAHFNPDLNAFKFNKRNRARWRVN
ncbi:hypothetical protein E2C01_071337 [Portunus trituberculatus]|uniref:Uncharacterized protein n=1 Tax=Portunus trituberculatus TaxID=210409 RepID=A0A5B7HZP8_PORTR|nr:hypothetical protein [Portunus trituberculatus]